MTLLKYAVPYTTIHLHVSVAFATIIKLLYKNTSKNIGNCPNFISLYFASYLFIVDIHPVR
jgi:hypothetical protein